MLLVPSSAKSGCLQQTELLLCGYLSNCWNKEIDGYFAHSRGITSLLQLFLKGWEDVLFNLGSERVKNVIVWWITDHSQQLKSVVRAQQPDQCQNSPAAPQEIWHHTVRRTWLSGVKGLILRQEIDWNVLPVIAESQPHHLAAPSWISSGRSLDKSLENISGRFWPSCDTEMFRHKNSHNLGPIISVSQARFVKPHQ